jgi:hypothetical protein
MSLTNIEGQDGCLFTIKGKKYIYAGLQRDNTTGKKVHTFYGLDGLDNGEEVNLTNFAINDAINESNSNADEAVLKMVGSPTSIQKMSRY